LIDAIRLDPQADKVFSLKELTFEFTENCRPMVVRHTKDTIHNTTRVAIIMPMALY